MDAVNVAVRIEEVVVVFVVVLSSSHVWLFSTRGLQHSRLPCPSLSPGVCSSSCPLHRWCHTTISSSATPFSFCLLSFPASGSSPVSQLFTSGGQRIGASASASVLPMSMRLCCRNKWSWISVIASRVLFLSFFFFFFFRFYCICYSIASVLCFDFVGYQVCGVFAPWLGIEPAPPAS